MTLRLRSHKLVKAGAVVMNGDVATVNRLLDTPSVHPSSHPSSSGWLAIYQARRQPNRAAHTVIFPEHYEQEFTDLFDRNRPPRRPTVYLCAQEKAHHRPGWKHHEPIFVMANAPAVHRGSQEPYLELGNAVHARCKKAGLIGSDDRALLIRTPTWLARRFAGSGGSLYGAASNSMTAAFRRPSNRVPRVPGLYLASGSVHPGGGLPLAMQSGQLAAQAVLTDLRKAR